MPQTTRTFLTVEQGASIANAILHLANAIEAPGHGLGARCADARELVREIAFPKTTDSETSKSTSPIVFSRVTCQRPDGTFETHVRRGGMREPDLSTPAPSCDAPSCDCEAGEDCKANVAAEDRVIVGMDYAKDGLVASAYLHKEGTVTPLPDSGDDFLAFLMSPCEPVAPVPSDARMVRVVCAERLHQGAMDRDVLVIDLGVDGHGDPFHPGDLVIQDPGLTGIREVVDIQLYPEERTRIGLVVRPVAMLLDPESAPPPEPTAEHDDGEEF